MYDDLPRCEVCHAYVDSEDLFCGNCGAEAPTSAIEILDEQTTSTHHFSCQGCGASMSYDASAQNLRCPFCGSVRLDEDPSKRSLKAKYVIPFNTTENDIRGALSQWMGRSIWRPTNLASLAEVTKVTAVYVPFWIFSARTFTNWTADSSNVPWSASGDWRPVTGEHSLDYRGVLVGASSVLSQVETRSICPFNLDLGKPPEKVDLSRFIVEQFRVQRKYARPMARGQIEVFEREACRKYVPGRARNVQVNTRLEGLSGQPVLLPVWVLAYRYKGDIYRFLANGQTGRHTGTAPVSWTKVVLAGAALFALILIILLIVTGFGLLF